MGQRLSRAELGKEWLIEMDKFVMTSSLGWACCFEHAILS